MLSFLLLLACLSVMAAIEYQFCWEYVWQQPERFSLQNQHETSIWAATACNLTRLFYKAGPKVVMSRIYFDNFGLRPLETFFSLQTCCWSKLSNGIWAIDFLRRCSWVILLFSAMQKQQAFRLINKSSTHLWCEKWNIYACQSNISVLQPHALLMPDGGWSKYQLV